MTDDSPFAKSQGGLGTFFKAAEHVSDLAIVFEFKSIKRDQPGYKGEGRRDLAIADIACFRNSEDVEKATPSLIIKDAVITGQVLVDDVANNDWVGKSTVQVIRRPNKAYVYRDNSTDLTEVAEKAAIEWFTAREAAVAAVDVPAFD